MNILGITLICIVLFFIWGGFLNASDNRKKKKESDEKIKKFHKDIEIFTQKKKEFQPMISESILRQKNAIEQTDKKQLINWYKKALALCHPNEFTETLNKLRKIHATLENQVPLLETNHNTLLPPNEQPKLKNPGSLYYEDVIENYKKYGYEKLFKQELYSLYRKRGGGGSIANAHYTPLECITIFYKQIYLKQHQENLRIEAAIKKELNKIVNNFDSWKSQAINDMNIYANSSRQLTLPDLLYFKKDHPSTPNYIDFNPTNPFDFPWHNSRQEILYAPRLITDEVRGFAQGYREDFYENREKYFKEYLERVN